MRIAFFGGSFNPPHNGHLAVARAALASALCDRVLFVVAYAPPHKKTCAMASFADRRNMTELLIANEPAMAVSDVEDRLRLNPSYTFKVLQALQRELPGDELALLIGGDSLRDLHLWYHAHELVRDYRVLSYPRSGGNGQLDEMPRDQWSAKELEKLRSGEIKGSFFEISSTNLRKALEKIGKTGHIELKHILPDAVLGYIDKKNLYRQTEET